MIGNIIKAIWMIVHFERHVVSKSLMSRGIGEQVKYVREVTFKKIF